jgi:hypothetical protein
MLLWKQIIQAYTNSSREALLRAYNTVIPQLKLRAIDGLVVIARIYEKKIVLKENNLALDLYLSINCLHLQKEEHHEMQHYIYFNGNSQGGNCGVIFHIDVVQWKI